MERLCAASQKDAASLGSLFDSPAGRDGHVARLFGETPGVLVLASAQVLFCTRKHFACLLQLCALVRLIGHDGTRRLDRLAGIAHLLVGSTRAAAQQNGKKQESPGKFSRAQ